VSVARFWQPGSLGRRTAGGFLVVPLILLFALGFLTLAYVAYVLWPRWPAAAVAPDAPALPVVVAGVTFNIPPAAMRVAVQRHAGVQERVDLAFQWPSLTPPDPQARVIGERLFVTIAGAAGTLAPAERLKAIYPRYAEHDPQPAPEGLVSYAFRAGTPYQGEDLMVDAEAPERFAARCTREHGPRTPGTCLTDRRIGEAEITLRFPRSWLDQWRAVAAGIDRLLSTLHPGG
jgi:hypothetical protein